MMGRLRPCTHAWRDGVIDHREIACMYQVHFQALRAEAGNRPQKGLLLYVRTSSPTRMNVPSRSSLCLSPKPESRDRILACTYVHRWIKLRWIDRCFLRHLFQMFFRRLSLEEDARRGADAKPPSPEPRPTLAPPCSTRLLESTSLNPHQPERPHLKAARVVD